MILFAVFGNKLSNFPKIYINLLKPQKITMALFFEFLENYIYGTLPYLIVICLLILLNHKFQKNNSSKIQKIEENNYSIIDP
jgi:ABC-type uncharacterized transport system permease subunit